MPKDYLNIVQEYILTKETFDGILHFHGIIV